MYFPLTIYLFFPLITSISNVPLELMVSASGYSKYKIVLDIQLSDSGTSAKLISNEYSDPIEKNQFSILISF